MPGRFLIFIIFLMAFPGITLLAQTEEALPLQNSAADSSAVPVMRYRISDSKELIYTKPKAFGFAAHIIPNTGQFFTKTFSGKNLIYVGGMVAGTATLYLFDRTITNAAKHLGHSLGIAPTNGQKRYAKLTIDIGNFRQP